MVIKQIKDYLISELQDNSNEIIDKIYLWIYLARKEIQKKIINIDLVSNVSNINSDYMLLPESFDRIHKVYLNNAQIYQRGSNWKSDITYKIENGVIPVEPASILTIESNDISDVPVIRINDIESVELPGTDPNEQNTVNTYSKISKIVKSVSNGDITIKDSLGNTVYTTSEKNIYEYTPKRISFNTSISGELKIEYFKKIKYLTDDYSSDEYTEKYGELITFYCLWKGFSFQNDSQLTSYYLQLYQAKLKEAISEDRKERNKNLSLIFKREKQV